MTTARDIVKKAFQKNGVLTKGEAMDGDEAVDGLFSLNALLSSWSNDNLLIYTRVLENFALTSGQSSYTIGAGGDFNTVRPIKIASAFIRQGNIDYALSIVNSTDFDLKIPFKNSGGIPDIITTDNGYPLNTIRMYPQPTGGQALYLRSEKPLTSLASLDTALSLPEGWERALIYNLAVEIAPEYGQQVDQVTYDIAQQSKAAIKTATARNRAMDSYPMANLRSNIYQGDT